MFRVELLSTIPAPLMEEAMMKSAAAMINAVGLLLVTAGTAIAQESFSDLQRKLKSGDRVSITDESGTETHGTFDRVGTSIRISAGGVEREWVPQQIREIRRRGDSVINGLKIGMLAGGAAGAVFGMALASVLQNEGHDAAGPFIAMIGLGVGAGAGIGAGLDAAITGNTVVYRRSSRTVSVASTLSPPARGIGVSLVVSQTWF